MDGHTHHLQCGCHLSVRVEQTPGSTTTVQKKRASTRRQTQKQKKSFILLEWHCKFDLIHHLYWTVSAASYNNLYLLWPSYHSSCVFTQLRWFQEGVGQFKLASGDSWKCLCHALLIHSGALTTQQRRWDGTHSQLILTCHSTAVPGASGSTPHLMCLSISRCQSPVERYMVGPHTQTQMASVTGTWHRLWQGQTWF